MQEKRARQIGAAMQTDPEIHTRRVKLMPNARKQREWNAGEKTPQQTRKNQKSPISFQAASLGGLFSELLEHDGNYAELQHQLTTNHPVAQPKQHDAENMNKTNANTPSNKALGRKTPPNAEQEYQGTEKPKILLRYAFSQSKQHDIQSMNNTKINMPIYRAPGQHFPGNTGRDNKYATKRKMLT